MESQPSAQEQLDALERDREQVRAQLVLPWWHHVAWGLTFCVFGVSTLLIESDWIFAIYAGTTAAFILLWRMRERRQGMRLEPPKDPRWKVVSQTAAGFGVIGGVFYFAVQLRSPWPLLVMNVVGSAAIVLLSIRAERRLARVLRDER